MIFYNDKIEKLDLGGGVARKVLAHSDNIMAVEVIFEKGGVGTLHTHEHEQVSYVLEGSFEVTIGDKKFTIKKGDTYYTEPNIVHGVLALEDGKLLDVFTPERKDFL